MDSNLSRRKFVKNVSMASFAAGALNIPLVSFGKSAIKNKKLGIALVGLGYYSTELLMPALEKTEDCYLAGIVTGTSEKEIIYGQKYNIPETNIYNYENFDEIIHNKSIDVVYVVLPNSMHKEFTIRAAAAGKHVICEKPMALNARDCTEMIRACKEANVFLSVGYRLHYDPANLEVMRYAKDKVFGEINFINVAAGFRWGDSKNHWKVKAQYGGGALMDMGVYPLQAARYATGMEPVAVTAQRYNPRMETIWEVDETTTFQFEFKNGIVANCMATFSGDVNFLKINASAGKYKLEPFCGYLENELTTIDGPMKFFEDNQQGAQMDSMCRAIKKGKPSRTPGEEGLMDMIYIDAIRESIYSGGKKVYI